MFHPSADISHLQEELRTENYHVIFSRSYHSRQYPIFYNVSPDFIQRHWVDLSLFYSILAVYAVGCALTVKGGDIVSIQDLLTVLYGSFYTKQVSENALNIHFEVAVALSGIIAPLLYIRLRKAQADQKNNDICLTDMSFDAGTSTVYSPVQHWERLDAETLVDPKSSDYTPSAPGRSKSLQV